MSAMQEGVLRFWFGPPVDDGLPPPDVTRRWFAGGPRFDDECRAGFATEVDAALRGEREVWAETPRGRLALVLLLDQLPRNLFRGSAAAFAGDATALRHAREAVASGEDQSLRPVERYFLYMPFEHAEDLDAQRQAIALFESLAESQTAPLFAGGVEWARRHIAVIERFGRFPARNAALGRPSTPEEEALLREHPSGF